MHLKDPPCNVGPRKDVCLNDAPCNAPLGEGARLNESPLRQEALLKDPPSLEERLKEGWREVLNASPLPFQSTMLASSSSGKILSQNSWSAIIK